MSKMYERMVLERNHQISSLDPKPVKWAFLIMFGDNKKTVLVSYWRLTIKP